MAPSDGEISSTESDPDAENDVTNSGGDDNEQLPESQSSDLSSLGMDEEHQVHVPTTTNNDQMSHPESTQEGDIDNENKPTSRVKELLIRMISCNQVQQSEDKAAAFMQEEGTDQQPSKGSKEDEPQKQIQKKGKKILRKTKQDKNMLSMEPSVCDTDNVRIKVNQSAVNGDDNLLEKQKLKPPTDEAQPKDEKKPQLNVSKYFMNILPCTKGQQDETRSVEYEDVEISKRNDSTSVSDTLDRQSTDPVSKMKMKPSENLQNKEKNMLKMAPSESDTSSDEDNVDNSSEKEKLESTTEAQPDVQKKTNPNVRKYFMSIIPCTKGLKNENDSLEDKDDVELSQLKENQIVCDRLDGQYSEEVNGIDGNAPENQQSKDTNNQSDTDGDDQTSNMQKSRPSKENRHDEHNIPQTRVTKFFMRIVPCTKDQTDVEMGQSESETNLKASDVKFDNEVNQSDEDYVKQPSDIRKLELTEKTQPGETKNAQSRAREYFMRIIPCGRGQQNYTRSVDNENDTEIYGHKENPSVSEGTNGISSAQVSTVIIKPLSNPQNKNTNLLKMAPSESETSDEESDAEPVSNVNQSHKDGINRLTEIQKLQTTNGTKASKEKKPKSSVREYLMGILPCHQRNQYIAGSDEYEDNRGLSDLKENVAFTDITAEKPSKRGKKKMKKKTKKASKISKKEETNTIKEGSSQCEPNSDDSDSEPENNASDPVEDEVEQPSDMENTTPTGETQPTKGKTKRSGFRECLMRIFPWNQVEKDVTQTTNCEDKVEEFPPINYRRKQLSARRLSKLNIEPLRNPGNMNPNLLKMAPSESDTSSSESDESDDEMPGMTEQPNYGTAQQSRVRKFFMRIAPRFFNNSTQNK